MKIVVAGALGHIGSKLSRDLAERFPGCSIMMIDDLRTQRYCSLFNLPASAKYTFIESDVMDLELAPILEGADIVIQLAAITNAAGSFGIREEVERNNFNTTRRLAEACAVSGSSLIHLSSTSVYGTQGSYVDESCSDKDLRPQSPYAETKLREEKLLQQCHKEQGLRFVTLRFGTICGVSPGMRYHTAVNRFCWQAVLGQPLTVWRTAFHQRRPYLTLDDAMRAICLFMGNDHFDGRIYNVLTDNWTVEQIVKSIERHMGTVNIEMVDNKIMNQLSYEVGQSRIESLGFRTGGNIDDCICETISLLHKCNAGGRKG